VRVEVALVDEDLRVGLGRARHAEYFPRAKVASRPNHRAARQG
jgi:hypothetical protein